MTTSEQLDRISSILATATAGMGSGSAYVG